MGSLVFAQCSGANVIYRCSITVLKTMAHEPWPSPSQELDRLGDHPFIPSPFIEYSVVLCPEDLDCNKTDNAGTHGVSI